LLLEEGSEGNVGFFFLLISADLKNEKV